MSRSCPEPLQPIPDQPKGVGRVQCVIMKDSSHLHSVPPQVVLHRPRSEQPEGSWDIFGATVLHTGRAEIWHYEDKNSVILEQLRYSFEEGRRRSHVFQQCPCSNCVIMLFTKIHSEKVVDPDRDVIRGSPVHKVNSFDLPPFFGRVINEITPTAPDVEQFSPPYGKVRHHSAI